MKYLVFAAIPSLLIPSQVNANSWICENNGVKKAIDVVYPENTPVPCHVSYGRLKTPIEKRKKIWSSSNTVGYCQKKAERTVSKLEYGGYQCTLVNKGTIEDTSSQLDSTKLDQMLDSAPSGSGSPQSDPKELLHSLTWENGPLIPQKVAKKALLPCYPEQVIFNTDNKLTTLLSEEAINKKLNWGDSPYYELILTPEGKVLIQYSGLILSKLYQSGGGTVSHYKQSENGIRYFYLDQTNSLAQPAFLEVANDLSFTADNGDGVTVKGQCNFSFYKKLPLLTRPEWR